MGSWYIQYIVTPPCACAARPQTPRSGSHLPTERSDFPLFCKHRRIKGALRRTMWRAGGDNPPQATRRPAPRRPPHSRCFLQMTHLRNVRFASVFSAYSITRLRFAVGALIMIRNLLAFVDRYQRVSRPPPTQAPRRKCGTPRHRCRGCGGLPAPRPARRGSPSARHRGCLRPAWRRSRRIRRRPG